LPAWLSRISAAGEAADGGKLIGRQPGRSLDQERKVLALETRRPRSSAPDRIEKRRRQRHEIAATSTRGRIEYPNVASEPPFARG
jgi:hypothetical protein